MTKKKINLNFEPKKKINSSFGLDYSWVLLYSFICRNIKYFPLFGKQLAAVFVNFEINAMVIEIVVLNKLIF